MKKNGEIFERFSGEKLSDAKLSGQLGHYQRQAHTWQCVGLAGIAGGVLSFFAVHNTLLKASLVAVLFFGGICCVLFPGNGTQKKIRILMQEQLGMFFKAELEKAFGPDLHTPEMNIDQLFIEELRLRDGQWEECEIEDFHEGVHRGILFSAAYVRLNHVYKRGNVRDGLGTWRDMVFKGLVLRFVTGIAAPSVICASTRTESSPHGIETGNGEFDHRFCVTAKREQDVFYLLTPQFMEMITAFEQSIEGRLLSFYWKDSIFSLALETDYRFAAVASNVDLSDLDAVRKSYITSLREMGLALDLLLKNTALFAGRE